MTKYRWLFGLTVLVLAALACKTVLGGGASPVEEPTREAEPLPVITLEEIPTELPVVPTVETPPEGGGGAVVATEFPLPADASGMIDLGEAGLTFQTGMSVEEAVKFYRDQFKSQGLTERELLTTITDTVFSMVFDGHESGKAIVIQGVDLGGGKLNIIIGLQDI